MQTAGNLVLRRKPDDQIEMNVRKPTCSNDQTAIRRTCEAQERPVDLGGVTIVDVTWIAL